MWAISIVVIHSLTNAKVFLHEAAAAAAAAAAAVYDIMFEGFDQMP